MRFRALPEGARDWTRSSRRGETRGSLRIHPPPRMRSEASIEIPRVNGPSGMPGSWNVLHWPRAGDAGRSPALRRSLAGCGRIEIPQGRIGASVRSDPVAAVRRTTPGGSKDPPLRVEADLQVRLNSELEHVLHVRESERPSGEGGRDHAAASPHRDIAIDRPVRRDRVID
jgi:hypothetical protein